MFKHLVSLCPACSPDSIIPVITDWAGCGLYGGFRLTEWAQDDSHSAIDNPFLEIHSQPKAFCLGDLSWKTGANHPLNLAAALHDESLVGRLSLTFKAQKNGENGEQHLFTRND
jgi:hypothetical protein